MKTKTTQKEMVCIHCHQDLQQKSFIKINGDYICIDCLVKNYFYCDNCRTWHLKTSEKTKIGALYFCENCKRMGIIRKCETCGTWHLTSDLPGLHIHFSRDYLNSDQTLLLTYFYSKHYDNFKKLSGRMTENSAYQWAAPNITSYGINSIDATSNELKLQAIKNYGGSRSDRYLAVNLNNEKTIEFRLGAGTTNYNKIKLWIDLHFTIFKNAKNININNVNDLKTWFSGRDDLLATFKGV